MTVSFEITEQDLKRLVISELQAKLRDTKPLDAGKVQILVKSKQNYKSEWETAVFKATYTADV